MESLSKRYPVRYGETAIRDGSAARTSCWTTARTASMTDGFIGEATTIGDDPSWLRRRELVAHWRTGLVQGVLERPSKRSLGEGRTRNRGEETEETSSELCTAE